MLRYASAIMAVTVRLQFRKTVTLQYLDNLGPVNSGFTPDKNKTANSGFPANRCKGLGSMVPEFVKGYCSRSLEHQSSGYL
jgi:hypothetical protein